MSLSNIVGQTFTADQISAGGGFDIANLSTLYRQTDIVSNVVTQATVTSYEETSGAISLAVNGPAGNYSVDATVVANDASDFLIFSTNLDGQVGYAYFTNDPASQPGIGNTVLVPDESLGESYSPACYCAGTRVGTPQGERAVEELRIGDPVTCVDGEVRPVRWIGTRSYAGRFLAANPALNPIRLKAGALGAATPSRDLRVSPKHAMMVDGVLVPAELLVDGVSVVRERGLERVDYLHIELDRHAAIWAEGAASETFVNDGGRSAFQNAGEFLRLYGAGGQDPEPLYCAPRVTGGAVLEQIRNRLSETRLIA